MNMIEYKEQKISQTNRLSYLEWRRNQILGLYSCKQLLSRFRINWIDNYQSILIHMIHPNNIIYTLKIIFGDNYPQQAPLIDIIDNNDLKEHLSEFGESVNDIVQYMWIINAKLSALISEIYNKIDKYTQDIQSISHINQSNNIIKTPKKYKRKNSHMNGCADKELTQTKNLNRHFRSKLRQVLRDLVKDEDRPINSYFIDEIFTPNRVGFQDIRKTLSNQWFNAGVKEQMKCGKFLHKILRGMMGIKSKKLMIKYYHIMVAAVEQPQSFIRWKYD